MVASLYFFMCGALVRGVEEKVFCNLIIAYFV